MPPSRRPRSQAGASLADDAIKLARKGLKVFPCGPDKAPRTPNGFKDASREPKTVAAWDWDGAYIGAAIPDGQVVLDVDPRNGGDETLEALRAAGHPLPKTRTIKTGGGGTHFYYRVPDDVELRGKLGNGVDVKRAGRGYVIVPPSPGYTVFRPLKVADLPGWALETLTVPDREGAEYEAHDPKFKPYEEGTRYGLAAQRGILKELADAGPGERNDALNRAAFGIAQLVAGGELKEETSREALEATARDIGLRDAEIRKTLNSGWDAGSAEPRQAPPRETAERDEATPATSTRKWLNWLVDEPPPRYLLAPVLPENSYVLVYGSSGSSKSIVFTELAMQAARRGVRSSIYSLENPPHMERDRLRRLGAEMDNLRVTCEPIDLNDPAQYDEFVADELAWGAGLVVLDTYSHAFESRTEDGNARAIAFARRIREFMHKSGAIVVVIDHVGYAQTGEPRDASAKRQQVDVAVLMEGLTNNWTGAGNESRFEMVNRKSSRFGNPFSLAGGIHDRPNRGLELCWDRGSEAQLKWGV